MSKGSHFPVKAGSLHLGGVHSCAQIEETGQREQAAGQAHFLQSHPLPGSPELTSFPECGAWKRRGIGFCFILSGQLNPLAFLRVAGSS